MINLGKFCKIKEEVENALNQALDNIKNRSLSDYILFIGNGEYIKSLEKSPILNPYTIDDKTWFYKDKTRLMFLTQFMNTFYSFPKGETEVVDDSFRINLEFMVYSHIWESTSFLSKMYRLAHLVNGEEYVWNVQVPETTKRNFINEEIKAFFQKQNMDFEKIIHKVYHSQLRNAFAHSVYNIDMDNKRIDLANYKGEDWQLEDISTDDWSERFVYSIWMSYSLFQVIIDRRKSLIPDFGTDTFTIKIPSKDDKVNVLYRPENDSFYNKTNVK